MLVTLGHFLFRVLGTTGKHAQSMEPMHCFGKAERVCSSHAVENGRGEQKPSDFGCGEWSKWSHHGASTDQSHWAQLSNSTGWTASSHRQPKGHTPLEGSNILGSRGGPLNLLLGDGEWCRSNGKSSCVGDPFFTSCCYHNSVQWMGG